MRAVAVALALLGAMTVPNTVLAQPAPVPPERSALDRVNLATEWATAIPVSRRGDGVALVQAVDGDQVFVQTKGGVLLAVDGRTGAVQWQLRYDAAHAPVLPVAVTDRHVIALNVITLYAIQRYTGQIDIQYNLPLTPTAPPAADGGSVFVVMSGQRLAAFELPGSVRMPDRELLKTDAAIRGGLNDIRTRNPADVVADRYPPGGREVGSGDPVFQSRRVQLTAEPGAGLNSLQKTPSLAVAASMLPPYRAFDEDGRYIQRSDSLAPVASLRQPYSRVGVTGQIQRTPSLAALPPSIAGVYEKANLKPPGVQPALRWVYGSTVRLEHQPLLSRLRVWSLSDGPYVTAVLRSDKTPQVNGRLPAGPSAPATQAEDIGYIPLSDGSLLAVNLTTGGGPALATLWRANVGGLMNHPPVVTADSVYMAGDLSGVARLDRKTGDLLWRTESTADRLAAVNGEYVYVRDRQGRLAVYDHARGVRLGALDTAAFGVPVTNAISDRVYLAADGGLLVCLRDTNPKYAVPQRIAPPPRSSVIEPAKPVTPPADAAPPAEKKEPEKKEPPKKEPEKKEPPKKDMEKKG